MVMDTPMTRVIEMTEHRLHHFLSYLRKLPKRWQCILKVHGVPLIIMQMLSKCLLGSVFMDVYSVGR
jgi:hypothetical protein